MESLHISSSETQKSRDVATLLRQLAAKGSNFVDGNSKSRGELLEIARSLCIELETPMEAILRMGWAQPTLEAAVRTALDLKLFDRMEDEDGSPKSSAQLAIMTGSDQVLISRILKHLASMEFIIEMGADLYGNTRLSKSLVDPIYRGGFRFCLGTLVTACRALPEQLANTGYRNPTEPLQSAFQLGHHTKLHAFEFVQKNDFVGFNNHMAGYSLSRARWCDPGCFPVEEILGKNLRGDKDDVLLVDVGGATGHDLIAFHERYPKLPGRLVLQDLPITIAEVEGLPDIIEPMAHDFFTEQPVKGARAYYIHSCLHDWPDDKCREILNNIIPAMTPGYSSVLINENVVPDKDAHWLTTSLDMVMISVFAATERTEKHWNEILNSVGLHLVKVWTYERGTQSLIEAELK